MKIAYCKPCKEVIAAGALLGTPDTSTPSPFHRHTVDGKVHAAYLAEVPDTPMTPKEEEKPQKYLDRLAKEHKGLFS